MRWLFKDGKPPDVAYANSVLGMMEDSSAIVPVIWGLEVANVIARAEANNQITQAQSQAFLELVGSIKIEVDTDTFTYALSNTLDLARRYRLTAYDASYLDLAMRLDLPLATLDENLQKAASKAGVKKFV
jgi:predicted nucleic acid-binding protein